MTEKIIWLVDENHNQLKASKSKLARILESDAIVETIYPPYRTKEEYLEVLEDERTVCIVLDQKLKDTGIASYTGIELAKYLRKINSKIPIFILTNFPDDISQASLWNVEEVLDKREFDKKLDGGTKQKILRERFLRRLAVYQTFREGAEARFGELLSKSLREDLSLDEIDELKKLQDFRTAPTLAREFSQLEELEKLVKEHRRFLDEFSSTIRSDAEEK